MMWKIIYERRGIYLTNKGLPWGAVCQEMGAGKHRAAAIRFSKPLRRNNIVIPAASFHSSFVASQALQLLYRWHQVKQTSACRFGVN